MQIGWGAAGGALVVLACYGVLTLKLFRLQMKLTAFQEQLLSIRNTTANKIRTSRREEMEQELLAFKNGQAEKPKRLYANDPVDF